MPSDYEKLMGRIRAFARFDSERDKARAAVYEKYAEIFQPLIAELIERLNKDEIPAPDGQSWNIQSINTVVEELAHMEREKAHAQITKDIEMTRIRALQSGDKQTAVEYEKLLEIMHRGP